MSDSSINGDAAQEKPCTIKTVREICKTKFLSSPFLCKKTDAIGSDENCVPLCNDYNENSALLDADLLILHILKKNRAWLLSHLDFDFSEYKNELFALAEKRGRGFPIAYITCCKEFYGKNFFVSPSVLIPKPDTELLVEEVLKTVKTKIQNLTQNENQADFFVMDICTGSGCIGISIADEFYKSLAEPAKLLNFRGKFYLAMADISDEALKICKKNASALLPKKALKSVLIKNLDLRAKNWRCFGKKYDIITANPPYVPSIITDELLKDGRNEPRLALDGGADGLQLIPPLAENIFKNLADCGTAFIEIGEYNAEKTAKIFENAGFKDVEILKDLSGQKRLLKVKKI